MLCPKYSEGEGGGYQCLCSEGFEGNITWDASNLQYLGECVDVDECSRDLHNCDVDNGAVCLNSLGSFECRCPVGSAGNGTICVQARCQQPVVTTEEASFVLPHGFAFGAVSTPPSAAEDYDWFLSNYSDGERARINFNRCSMQQQKGELSADVFSGLLPYATCEDDEQWTGGRDFAVEAQLQCSSVTQDMCAAAVNITCSTELELSSRYCDSQTSQSIGDACCLCGGGAARKVMNGSWVSLDRWVPTAAAPLQTMLLFST